MADRRLQVFHAVAKHLSFTKAADALFMTQPAVTFQIKQLEGQIPLRPPLIRNFSVVYPKERFHSKLVGSFLQFARVWLAGTRGPSVARSANDAG